MENITKKQRRRKQQRDNSNYKKLDQSNLIIKELVSFASITIWDLVLLVSSPRLPHVYPMSIVSTVSIVSI